LHILYNISIVSDLLSLMISYDISIVIKLLFYTRFNVTIVINLAYDAAVEDEVRNSECLGCGVGCSRVLCVLPGCERAGCACSSERERKSERERESEREGWSNRERGNRERAGTKERQKDTETKRQRDGSIDG